MKIGDQVITPNGKGIIVKTPGGLKQKENFLVNIKSNKYWPHWNIFYNIKELKYVQPK